MSRQSGHIVNPPLCSSRLISAATEPMSLLTALNSYKPFPPNRLPQNQTAFTDSIENFTLLLHCLTPCKTAFSTTSDRFAQTRTGAGSKKRKNANVAKLI